LDEDVLSHSLVVLEHWHIVALVATPNFPKSGIKVWFDLVKERGCDRVV